MHIRRRKHKGDDQSILRMLQPNTALPLQGAIHIRSDGKHLMLQQPSIPVPSLHADR